MAIDLSQSAKNKTLSEFEKDYAKEYGLKLPLEKDKAIAASEAYSRYRTSSDIKPNTSGNQGILSKSASAQGFTTGYGLVSSEAAGELIDAQKIADAAVQVGKALFGSGTLKDGLKNLFSTGMTNLFDEMVKMVDREVELRNKLNGQIGIGKELSRGYRDNIVDAYDKVQGMGYSFDELAETAISATKETGRFFTMNESVMQDMAVTSRAFIGDMKEMGPILRQFEEVGVGAEKTLENINTAGKSALTLGLNVRTTTAELNKNLGKLNEYGFANGVQGLASMVRKATEFRMSMEETFKIADKVMSPEGAIDLAANLQVLGGAIGSLGDPFQMMYMATNNVEGLQDALIGAAESLTTYNSEQGRFEITGVNLRRAKAMAQELGISYQELAKGAIAAAERSSAASDLMTAGITVDEKQQEFITNLARMGSGGKMVIEVPPSLAKQLGVERTLALEDLDQSTANAILENQKAFEKMDAKDIALEQFTETQKMALSVSEISAMLKVEFAKTYRSMGAEMDTQIAKVNTFLRKYTEGDRTNTELNEQIDAKRKELQKAVDTDLKTKTSKPVPESAQKVDNTSKTSETNQTTENKFLTRDDFEQIIMRENDRMHLKGQNNVNFSLNGQPVKPGSYLE